MLQPITELCHVYSHLGTCVAVNETFDEKDQRTWIITYDGEPAEDDQRYPSSKYAAFEVLNHAGYRELATHLAFGH